MSELKYIHRILQPIDLSTYPKVEGSTNVVSFHGIEVKYCIDNSYYFAITSILKAFGKSKGSPIAKLFGPNIFDGILNKFNLTKENTSIEYGPHKEKYYDTKLLWISIYWQSEITFIELMCKVFGNFDLYHDLIEPDISSWFGLHTNIDKETGFISRFDILNSLKVKYSIMEKTSYKDDAVGLNNHLTIFKEKNDFKLEKYRSDFGERIFIHPNAMVIYIHNYKPSYFWDSFLEYYSRNDKYIEKLFDFEILEDVTNDVGYAKVDDIMLKIHKKTSFVHAKTTADLLDPKKAKNIDRWLSQKDTIEFITELEYDIRNGVVPYILAGNAEVKQQLMEHPSYIMLTLADSKVNEQGYYFHPVLHEYMIMWLNKSYFFKRMMNTNKKSIAQIYVAKKCIADMNEKIGILQEAINDKDKKLEGMIVSNSGSIVVNEYENKLHIYRSKTNEPESKNRITFCDINDINLVYDMLLDKVSRYIKPIRRNLFEGNIEDSKDIIKFLIDETIDEIKIEKIEFQWNKDEFIKRDNKYKETLTPQDKGFLYESYCSYHLNAFLIKDLPKWFTHKFGLDGSDLGIDLFDLKNRICYQCKYYSELKMSHSLERTKATFKKIKTIDSRYHLKIVVPTECIVAEDVKRICDEVINLDVKDFLSFVGIEIHSVDMRLNRYMYSDDSYKYKKTVEKDTLLEENTISIEKYADKSISKMEKDETFKDICKDVLKINDGDDMKYLIMDLQRLQKSRKLEFFVDESSNAKYKVVVPKTCVVTDEAFNLIGGDNIIYIDIGNRCISNERKLRTEDERFIKFAAAKLKAEVIPRTHKYKLDLVDENNKILYYCKSNNNITKSREMIKLAELFDSIEDYKCYLVVKSGAIIYVNDILRDRILKI